ncbi:hypothetical protein BHYA_0091g00230 [Botrytis hyacinthi]|uniref:Uncharacterized protein n=1 Tax=Botrytis hyacinthi TaxID=278943 RepID=A0A4Z1GSF2_9HELO|nr:hypothetical protein BHYA_0091g00230 [Botrytis hyacinthi]
MITDGGGIRGLSELTILDEIINRLKYALKSPVDLLPADYFDMICGLEEIFKNKRSNSLYGHAFESSNMERAIKNLPEVKYGQGHDDDRMLAEEEETRHSCKAFVCVVSSSHVEGDPNKFRTCIGAGIPKALGFTRPKFLWEKVAPISLVKVLEGMATSMEKEAAEMEKKYRNIPGVYNRVNVGRDIGDIGLEELEELGYSIPIGDLLEEEAMNILFHRSNQERMHENTEDTRKICCHLSCLALAVDQAGVYIKSTGI